MLRTKAFRNPGTLLKFSVCRPPTYLKTQETAVVSRICGYRQKFSLPKFWPIGHFGYFIYYTNIDLSYWQNTK